MIIKSDLMILGIGNYLMGDEGIGVHTALALEQLPIAETIDVVDGGTGGFHLLEFFEVHDKVILIDATLDNNEPGTIRLIKPRFAKDFPRAMSTHDIGLRDMVNALQLMDKLPEIYLFFVSIASIQQQGIELTPVIEKTIPVLIERIIELANQLQEENSMLAEKLMV
jgi:hydrogenase maturation protease